jgi:hypothetical protein
VDFIRRLCEQLSSVFGFYGRRGWGSVCHLGVLLILGVALYAALNSGCRPCAAAVVVATVLYVIALSLDSANYLYTLLRSSSDGRAVDLVKNVDSLLEEAIVAAERAITAAEAASVDIAATSYSRALLGDFRQRPLFPRVARRLFAVIGLNFLFTVAGFSFLAMAVSLLACGGAQCTSPYGHSCIEFTKRSPGDFAADVFHFFYYQSMVFQTVGDGAHSPATPGAQAVAIFGFVTYIFNMVVMLGGTLSAIMYVHSEFTPDSLCDAVRSALRVVVSDRAPFSSDAAPGTDTREG